MVGVLGVPIALAAVLVGLALVVGVLLTSVGASGFLTTVALYVFTPLSPAEVAGTPTNFVPFGVLGALAYYRSGELATRPWSHIAVVMSATGLIGALAGTELNVHLPVRGFELALGVVVAFAGLLLLYRESRGAGGGAVLELDPTGFAGYIVYGTLGGIIGTIGGMLGLGGPALAVPSLVLLGVSIRTAVGIAQLQLVFISGTATAGYLVQDAVSLPLLVLVGVPQVAGAFVGWVLAHRTPEGRLRVGLAVVLVLVGFYLVA
jgi:uncharacterized membrane protein YfcA